MAKLVNELKILQFKNVYLFPNKLVNGFAVASESHASTPLPTFATANLVEPQRAKDRHWHYTNTLAVILKKILKMLKLTNISIIITTTLLFLVQCKAQTETINEQGKSGIETRADIAENLNNSKIQLDKVYNESLSFLKSINDLDANNYKLFLIESQNGWKIYSEGKCKIMEYESKDAAQGGQAFYNICITELNNIRTVEIKKWLEEWKLNFKKY